ncbi:MBL fold metallo-hydrolase [candidate division KSB1 bacterium]|nr:MBL fold metallo-hydrolase [candidate division KSB1 bacterium]
MSRVILTGTAAGLPVLDRMNASWVLQYKEHTFLFDAGEGVSRSLLSSKIDPHDIEKIFISHTHPDHISGLPVLLQMMFMTDRRSPLEIYLPASNLPIIERFLLGVYLIPEKMTYSYTLMPIRDNPVFKTEGIEINVFPNGHLDLVAPLARQNGVGAESYGFDIKINGKRVIYTSDFQRTDDIEKYVTTADLLIVECSHAGFEEILEFLQSRKIGRTVLNHILPQQQKEAEALPILAQKYGVENVSVAADGMIFEI